MRRFLTLVFLLVFTIPFGVSISGCSKKEPVVFCSTGDTGPAVGQVAKILLGGAQPIALSFNQTQIGQAPTPTAQDCKGTAETVSAYTYATFDANGTPDITIADVQPTTGRLCAGTWNRNTGGGIADFTTCMPTGKSGTAYLVASGNGASSNRLPIFVHPVVTSVVLGPLSTDCLHDPATNCSTASFTTTGATCTIDPGTGCCTAPVLTAGGVGNGCLSQASTGQLAARAYQGTDTTLLSNNISCQVGNLAYSAVPATVVSIDQNGVATAQLPGSAVITATIAQAGSSAGTFSTCPPVSIALTVPPTNGTSTTVNINNTQPITSVVTDQNGVVLTGVPLEFVSTTPTTIPAATPGTITPLFPGAAAITAICQPPACNPSPLNQVGFLGNGKPITSNNIQVTAPGKNSTVLFMASTESLYIVPVDFTTSAVGTPVRLPYQPNSMVINNAGTSIFMGSASELMTFSTATNQLASADPTVTGNVLAVSPDGSTLVISDPSRQLIYLYSVTAPAAATGATAPATGAVVGVIATYGGVGTHAEFTPDSQTAYITLGNVTTPATSTTPAVVAPNNQLLVHSSFTGWFLTTPLSPTSPPPLSDLAITVPSVGVFFSGTATTARGYCPVTTAATDASGQTTTTNVYYPDAGVSAPATDRIAATNDGLHIVGATATAPASLVDLGLSSPSATAGGTPTPGVPTGACPPAGLTFGATPTTHPLTGVTASSITGVDLTSGGNPATDPIVAFVTYNGTGSVVPAYNPLTGILQNIPLATSAFGTPVAPIAGVVSADNQTFYVGTSGDNVIHVLTKGGSTMFQDITTPIAPALPCAPALTGGASTSCGTVATPNLLVQKPRTAIS
jgi:hypothetical protein